MAFRSSPSTAARPSAPPRDAKGVPTGAPGTVYDLLPQAALPADPLPASAVVLPDHDAGSSIDIPPMPGRERNMRGTAAVGSPTASTGGSAVHVGSAVPIGFADVPSVTSEALPASGATGGKSRDDAHPADVIALPASDDAAHGGGRSRSDDALPAETAGTSSELPGRSATLVEAAREGYDNASDRIDRNGWGAGAAPESHDVDSGGGTGSSAASSDENDPDADASSLDLIVDSLSDPSTWVEGPATDFGALPGGASSVQRTVSPGAADSYSAEGSADTRRQPVEDAELTVIALPDLSGDAMTDIDDGYLRQLADAPAVSSDRDDPEFDDLPAQDAASHPDGASAPVTDRARRADRTAETVPSTGETAAPLPASDDERVDGGGTTSAAPDGIKVPTNSADSSLDDGLLQSIVNEPSVSSNEAGTAAPASGSGAGDEQPEEIDDTLAIPVVETAFDGGPHDKSVAHSEVPDAENAAELHDIPFETVPPGPSRALAFAADPDTEAALRDGLLGYEGSSPGYGDPQVWQGGLRAAIGALNEGHSAPLIFVDVDRIAYPAGAIHELAAVCEVGTVVIALGSDNTARPGRELLLAGVSDYLTKPLTAEAVRAAAHRAAPDAADRRTGGCVAGFVGSGGSGTTTVLAAAALQAAERGCYVSVLDLDRSVAAAALTLGVEPAAGLDQLLEAAGKGTPDPEMVEGVCTRRSDRIHVYAHRWDPTLPAVPSREALDSLLAVLRDRSQLVLVDGLDEPTFRLSSSSELDTRVFVAEPTAANIAPLGHTMSLLGAGPPLLFVQNHTRAFKRGGGARALRSAGLTIAPDVMIPFEPELPEAADRGWPQPRLPRSLRKPVRALTDRLLEPSRRIGAGVAASPPMSS